MDLVASDPLDYLAPDAIIESDHPEIQALAAELRTFARDDVDFARAAFEWVRDNVSHSFDVHDPRVTLTASEALRERVGLCYPKAHLLVALLRAERIAAGLCYQRLADEATGGHAVHGLVAVHLNGRWHRQDPRGNKPGIDAQFSLHQEQLAWTVDAAAGEIDYPTIYIAPAPEVVDSLSNAEDVLRLYGHGLPAALNG